MTTRSGGLGDGAGLRTSLITATIIGLLLGGCALPAPIGSPSGSAVQSPPPSSIASRSAAPTATPSATAGDRLEIVCSGGATVVDVPLVAVQDDGLHVDLMNTSGQPVRLTVNRGADGQVLEEDLGASGGTLVAPLAPGSYEVTCGGPEVAFAIVDPRGVHVSTTLACDVLGASGTIGSIDYGPDARGPRGRLVDVARLELRGLRDGDRVERAGYPAETSEHVVRVVRGGAVAAALWFDDDGDGGWLLTTTRTCAGSNLTAQPPD